MDKKVLGSILMILGTSIGAGMLALPIVTAYENYFISLFILCAGWLVMTVGAFSLLEVNLWLKPGANLISMANATLGKWGKWITWIAYLLLLYSLICAYLSSSSDILQALLLALHLEVPRWTATLLALVIFGFIVYRGISSVDAVNRVLMSIKIIAYLILVLTISKYMHFTSIITGDYYWHNSTFMIMLSAFGYAVILPSLRTYLNSDKEKLKKVVLLGSLLPLIVYSIWIAVVQGLIPRNGETGLIQMSLSSHTNSLLMDTISQLASNVIIGGIAKVFISICALTSFLGVSICLTDFIADGLKLNKLGWSNLLIYLISYLPPLLIVLFAPGIFIKALNYAGILCVLLLIILPTSMLYNGRYIKNYSCDKILPLSKNQLLIFLIFSSALLLYQIIYYF